MYIGKILQERFNKFGFTLDSFCETSMLEKEFIQSILDDKIQLEEIDDFDLGVISSTLYCESSYFLDKESREKDVVFLSKNRGIDSIKSNLAKAKLQSYIKDIIFLRKALS